LIKYFVSPVLDLERNKRNKRIIFASMYCRGRRKRFVNKVRKNRE